MRAAKRPSGSTHTKSSSVFRFRSATLGIAIIGLFAASSYFISSAASSNKAPSSKLPSAQNTSGGVEAWDSAVVDSLAPALSGFLPFLQAPAEPIATFAADCTTPKSDFNLGETVCAKASGVPVTLFPWRVLWVDPEGFVRQAQIASSNDATTYFYTLPSSRTSTVNGESVSNVGTWRANLARSNGSVRASAPFRVHDVTQPTADVSVQKFVRGGENSVPSGGNIAFLLVVENHGPDAATMVHLADSTPSGGQLLSFSQESGPPCVPADSNDCTMATLAAGERAEFTAVYNTGTASGTVTTSATVFSTTSDPDTSNNTSTAEFTVTGGGGGGTCSLTCPTGITTQANTTHNGERGAVVSYDEPLGSGNCGAISSTPVSGSFFPVGTTVVTATSESGGGSCTFTITVEDADVPTISCPGDRSGVADANCQAVIDPGQPTTTGADVTVTSSRSDERPLNDPFPSGVTIITWTATNSSGSTSCDQRITVADNTPPTITAPAGQSASADESCLAATPDFASGATTSDNCGTVDVAQDPAAGDSVGIGTHTITLTATDGNGNTATATTTFTVSDMTAPTVQAPADSSADANASCRAAIPDYVSGSTATDNCDSSVTLTQSPAAGTLVGSGPHTVTVSATDSAGNTGSDEVVFTVVDSVPPTVVAPPDSGADADANCQAAVPNYAAASTTSDNCDSSVTVTQNPAAGTMVGPGSHTVTVTATDDANNSSSDTVVFTVTDNTPPTISCQANIVVYVPVNSTATSAVVNYTAPTGSDNCSGATTAQTAGLPSGSSFPLGTTTNTFTVTDGANHTASCSFTVTVLYNFTGFLSPVSNPPTVNSVKAGQAIPLKFSLSGNKGLAIFAPGSPASQQIACDSSAPLSELEGTDTPGGSTLTYSPDQYHYNWKTEKSWAGTCRQLVVTLNDGTTHTALFKFK